MFNEETNVTDAGRHFTPRDIVELIADLAFIPIQDKIKSTSYRIYDGACGSRVIIMTVANSLVNMRVLELLPKFKTSKFNRWCTV